MKKILVFSFILINQITFCSSTEESIGKLQKIEAIKKEEKKNRSVIIQPKIDRNDLGYNKFFSTYYPEKLDIKINGKQVYSLQGKDIENKEVTIPVDGNKLTVEYDYEWDMITGKRTGTKRVEFDLNNDTIKKLELEFGSWKDENRIVIPQAKQVGKEEKIK